MLAALDQLTPHRGVAIQVNHQVEASLRIVALSAWSAGFVGIEAGLAQPASKNVDAVILIDGLHAPRGDDNAFKAQLRPFVE